MLARIRKSAEGKDQGFTLVELLVVMIIIGILAAVAIPVFLNQRKKAVDTSIKSDLRSVAQEVETAYVDTQAYPASATYTADTTATKALFPANTLQTSTGNVISYQVTATGYCLRGHNPKANADGTTAGKQYFIFDSQAGGLQTAAAASSANC